MRLFIEGAEFFGVGEIWANASTEAVKQSLLTAIRSTEGDEDASETERVLQFAGAF